ncbi:MAG TPA: glucose-6-phosphate isomerase [Longimicrobiales bacterium]|nr:glucose-6-phosphate isomerase [Longimicrobiales bacterium]
MDRIALDYSNMLSHRLGGRGIPRERLLALGERFAAAHDDVQRRRDAGELGFYRLPFDEETVATVQALADRLQQNEDLVVLGIGGSALGTTAVHRALCAPFWNELSGEAREHYPRLYVLDNVDPRTMGGLLERLEPGRTLFNVISKSGSTAETLAQYLVVRDWLEASLGDGYRRHLVITTEQGSGPLRGIADAEGIETLPIPIDVGGRFSVLSAVGLFPVGLVGVDIAQLVAGARAMTERCDAPELAANPAGLFAALQYLAHTEGGAPIHVMMPYADRLLAVGDWFRQLWAESLGKRVDLQGREVHTGPTPVTALGATDQHSQVQLYMEGPFDKTVTFVTVADPGDDVAIPADYADTDAIAYLGGHTIGELLRAEAAATSSALTSHGRMNMTIELPRVDAHTLGQLLMMMQIATVYAGAFYGIDPLDQPGVELGKKLTYGLMGRRGHDAAAVLAPDPDARAG